MRRRDVLRGAGGIVRAAGLIGGAGPAVGEDRSATAEPYAPLGRIELPGAREAVVGDGGTTAYVATMDGFATVDVGDPREPALLAQRDGLLADHQDGPMAVIQDVAVAGDRLLVAGPAHPEAAVPRGVLVVDVADPVAPRALAFHETGTAVHNCTLHDGVAYLTAGEDGGRLAVVDVAGDQPRALAEWGPTDHDDVWEDVQPGARWVHDVWVAGDRAYVPTWDAGTFVLDVSDPAAPAVVARIGGLPLEELTGPLGGHRYQLPGNHHYARTSPDGTLLAIGREAWNLNTVEGGRPGGIDLWDVSTPADPVQLSHVPAERARDEGYLSGTWTTSHNVDLANDRLYTSWYQGGVKLFDASDPAAPVELAWWREPAEAAFWTAQRAANDAFVASTTAGAQALSGLSEGLYTFPDRAGEQVDPPVIPTPTPTPTPTATDSGGGSSTSTTQRTPPRTPPSPRQGSPTATSSPETNPVAGDGFGPLAGLAALLGATWWRRRD